MNKKLMSKKIIIAGAIALVGIAAYQDVRAAAVAKSPAFNFTTREALDSALDDLEGRFPEQTRTIEEIRTTFSNTRISNMQLKLKMLKIYTTLPDKVKTEVTNLFGMSPVGYEHLLGLARV